MFKSIVVGFDGSSQAGKALKTGADLAAKNKARLGIIFVVDSSQMQIPDEVRRMGEVEHVIDPMPDMLINFEDAPSTMMNTMRQASYDSERALYQYADFMLSQAVDRAQKEGVEDIDSKSVSGNPAEAIAAYARDCDADLIITGSRGFGKMKSLVLGSTSHKISQIAECSNLTVR